jgi:hypothetical protein
MKIRIEAANMAREDKKTITRLRKIEKSFLIIITKLNIYEREKNEFLHENGILSFILFRKRF